MDRARRTVLQISDMVVAFGLLLIPSLVHAEPANQPEHWGSRYHTAPQFHLEAKSKLPFALDAVRRWNGIMLDANGADHALSIPDQVGPLRTARAFAIVQIAIFDAVNA